MKEWILRTTILLGNFMVLGFGISLATSRYWRLWEFNSKTVHLVYIGLWEAYYYQEFNKSGSITRVPMHSAINSSWTISIEIEYARGLILLASFMQLLVLIFILVAIIVCWIKGPYSDFMILYYNTSVFFLVLNIICTVSAVSWNHMVDLYGNSTLDFPPIFPIRKDHLLRKQKTHVFPMGMMTAMLSVISIFMLLYEICSIKPKTKIKPVVVIKPLHEKT